MLLSQVRVIRCDTELGQIRHGLVGPALARKQYAIHLCSSRGSSFKNQAG